MNPRPDYAGMDNFVWWHGVVEDVHDPKKLGRVRVRILGWNTEDKSKNGIPTESLPWAQVMMPVTSPSMTGLGVSPSGLLQGCWVIGFFLDGTNCQQPIVMGTYAGYQKPDTPGTEDTLPYNDFGKARGENAYMDYTKGFRDPDKTYPIEGRMNEPDTNRLARNEFVQWTAVEAKNASLVEADSALYGSWKEPASPYAAVYPHNQVKETPGGHIVEFDDTPDAERIHVYHKSGTFTEIHPQGGEVHKVVGNAWDITIKDKMVYVEGTSSETIGKSLKIKVGQNLEIETDGDMRILTKGNVVMETLGDMLHKVKGKLTMASEGNMLFVAPRIDLNPQGTSAGTIKTILSTLRSTASRLFGGGG